MAVEQFLKYACALDDLFNSHFVDALLENDLKSLLDHGEEAHEGLVFNDGSLDLAGHVQLPLFDGFFKDLIDVDLQVGLLGRLVVAFLDQGSQRLEVELALSPHERVLLRGIVSSQHIQKENHRLDSRWLNTIKYEVCTYIDDLLAYAFDGSGEILPDLDAFVSEQSSDDEILDVLDREHLVDVRPVVIVEGVDEVPVLDEGCEPEAESVLDYKGVVLCELLLSQDQADKLKDLVLEILEVNLAQDVQALP